MTTRHDGVSWVGGDDWQINATLLDENGSPFDLSGSVTIKWCLLNAAYQLAIDETDVVINIVNAALGECSILIPASATSPLPGGKYSDAIRIVTGGVTSTLSVGPIYVTADPWAAIPAAGATIKAKPQLRLASG